MVNKSHPIKMEYMTKYIAPIKASVMLIKQHINGITNSSSWVKMVPPDTGFTDKVRYKRPLGLRVFINSLIPVAV